MKYICFSSNIRIMIGEPCFEIMNMFFSSKSAFFLETSSKTQKQNTAFPRITRFTRMELVENTNPKRCEVFLHIQYMVFEIKEQAKSACSKLFLFCVAISKRSFLPFFLFFWWSWEKLQKKKNIHAVLIFRKSDWSLILFFGKEDLWKMELWNEIQGTNLWDRILSTTVLFCLVDQKFQRVLLAYISTAFRYVFLSIVFFFLDLFDIILKMAQVEEDEPTFCNIVFIFDKNGGEEQIFNSHSIRIFKRTLSKHVAVCGGGAWCFLVGGHFTCPPLAPPRFVFPPPDSPSLSLAVT